MPGLLKNPLVLKAVKSLPFVRRGQSLAMNVGLLTIAFAVLVVMPTTVGVCPCTMFSLASLITVLACCLGVGNSVFGALTAEREKKTLDSLRLTQLSAHEVLLGKLLPEFLMIAIILIVCAPSVLFVGVLSGYGVAACGTVLLYALLGGLFAAVMSIFLSSLFQTTSQAVVAGWIAKGIWLGATPLLDMVAGAVLVQNPSPPLFTMFNPLAALGVLLIPEAASGSRTFLPMLFPAATAVAVASMWCLAAWRFATGMESGGGLRDNHVHPVYRQGWGPSWLGQWFPLLRDNPAFLRELAGQVRAGAGRWPGYMVFVVLFLAPTFYARSWSLNELGYAHLQAQQSHVEVMHDDGQLMQTGIDDHGVQTAPVKGVHMHTFTGTEVYLEGHTDTACLRMFLFREFGVPLPKDALHFYQTASYTFGQGSHAALVPVSQPDTATVTALHLDPDAAWRPQQNVSEESREAVTRASLHVGIAGAIALLLLYLGIRFSAFLAGAVTGERSRRTWEDLALTGLPAHEAMAGKVVGSILLPTLQMTVVFPLLLLFVASDNLGLFEVGGLYVYAVALSVAAAMLGLWASSEAATSHDAHLRTLVWVLVAFFALPLGLPLLHYPLAGLCLLGMFGAIGRNRFNPFAWLSLSVVLAFVPQALSPLTAAVSFMPSLTSSQSMLSMLGVAPGSDAEAMVNFVCGLVALLAVATLLWNAAMAKLADPAQQDAIRAERPELTGVAC